MSSTYPLIVMPTTLEDVARAAESLITAKVVHCKVVPNCTLIDRTTKFGNRFWDYLPAGHTYPVGTDGKHEVPHNDQVKIYGTQLMAELQTGKLSFWDLYDLRCDNLGCWCKHPTTPDKPCHGDVVVQGIKYCVAEMIKAQWIHIDGREMVGSFTGSYQWLSNMYPCQPFVDEHGISHRYSETYYMAEKTDDIEMKKVLAQMTGFDAKKHARSFKLEQPGWKGSDKQIDAMRRALRYKYSDPVLRAQLLATGDMYLREGNNHYDKFWGHCLKTQAGCNVLGILLMELRDELRLLHP